MPYVTPMGNVQYAFMPRNLNILKNIFDFFENIGAKTMSQLKIIAIEGAESVGKSTIAEMLADDLDIKLIKFPNESLDSGKLLNDDDPLDPAFSRYHENKIDALRTLRRGTYIFDGFKLSEIIYGLANGANEQDVRSCANLLPDPDITFLITGKSYGYDTDVYGNDPYHSMITKLYLTEAKNSSGRIEIINNEKPIDDVFEEVFRKLRGIDF